MLLEIAVMLNKWQRQKQYTILIKEFLGLRMLLPFLGVFRLIRMACVLAGTLLLGFDSAGFSAPVQRNLSHWMKQVRKADGSVQEGIKDKDKSQVLQSLDQMKEAFQKMKELKPVKGDPELYRQYCEISLGILSDVQSQIQHSYWSAAENSYARIKDLNKDIRKDFLPGRWQRFKNWFKDLF